MSTDLQKQRINARRRERYRHDEAHRERAKRNSNKYHTKVRERRQREKERKEFIKSVKKGISIHLQEHLRSFVATRTALNYNELSRLSGWAGTSFSAWMYGKVNMPDKVQERLTEVLQDYGYKPKKKAQVRA